MSRLVPAHLLKQDIDSIHTKEGFFRGGRRHEPQRFQPGLMGRPNGFVAAPSNEQQAVQVFSGGRALALLPARNGARMQSESTRQRALPAPAVQGLTERKGGLRCVLQHDAGLVDGQVSFTVFLAI